MKKMPEKMPHHMDAHIGEFPELPPDIHAHPGKGGRNPKSYHGTVNGYGLGGAETSNAQTPNGYGVEGSQDGADDMDME